MKRLLLILCFPFWTYGQNTIGLPDVINYSNKQYGAGLQNWDIKQDKNGIIYFANNEGLLSFDGNNWKLYPLPNKTIVRSVEIGVDGYIYVGGQDELGYFSPAANGLLQYHSLTNLLAAKDQNFGDVWDIVTINKNVFFRTTSKIFKLTSQAIAAFGAPNDWLFMGQSNGTLYAQDSKKGILYFDFEDFRPVSSTDNLPTNEPVTAILSLSKDSLMVTTLRNGIYLIAKGHIAQQPGKNNAYFGNARIYTATFVSNQSIALGTNYKGVIIIDKNGNILQSFSTDEGLQNNNILSIFLDKQQNLWLGLDNGIDLVAYNSAVKTIRPTLQKGSGYTALRFKNNLLLGTTNGLYSIPIQDSLTDLSYTRGTFVAIKNTQGQTWTLSDINDHLLMGHHDGAFEINGNVATPLSNNEGYWKFLPLSSTFPSQRMVGGNYKGLTFFNFVNGRFIQSQNLAGFTESSRFVAIDQQKNIWVSHPYHGVFKISQTDSTHYTFQKGRGLPSNLNNHIYKLKNEIVVATGDGIYTYNPQKDAFETSAYYKKILGNLSIRYLKEDPAGNIWFIHEKNLGVIDLSGKEPAVIYLPELNNKLLSGFEFVYPLNENNIFIGGEEGFLHINYEKYKQTNIQLSVQVRNVRAVSNTDSLIFGGYYAAVNDPQLQLQKNIPSIKHGLKTLHFDFSSPLLGYQSKLEYSYRLKDFDNNWSAWTKKTEKEYTNLPAGNFVFEVKVRNNLGTESPVASYSFVVLPPWYFSTLAKIFLVLLFIGLNYLFFKWLKNKFTRQQQKHDEEQRRLLYIHELELNKTASELVTLRNEKLEAEIHFKNSELASSAMHLVKKGELLTKVKSELNSAMKGVDQPKAAADLKKLVKSLSEDDSMDKEWDHFAKHFDKVHSDFVSSLKEKHPAITSNELKLCAYLRMNLSTKEIAQLMNISVRGVEISRYRLRKKLQLPTEVSLFDYLISLKQQSTETLNGKEERGLQ